MSYRTGAGIAYVLLFIAMVHLVNLKHNSRKKAFIAGFWKGLGAPVLLASSFDLDEKSSDYKFKPLPDRKTGSLSDDWRRVGSDIRSAIELG